MAKTHTVKSGDCISSIAFENGFFPDTIWNHPENAALKADRVDPNVLLPGDQVFVPDKTEKQELCVTNKRHVFRRRGVPQFVKIQMRFMEKPWANLEYTFVVGNERRAGKTNGDGWLREPIPPNAKMATLILYDGTEYQLELGTLRPADEIVGVQDRLKNLGYYHGPASGTLDEETRIAISDFQRTHELAETGEVDGQTRKLLQELTGS
jgi:N-acetylmuramoyl-L-alanine amidase